MQQLVVKVTAGFTHPRYTILPIPILTIIVILIIATTFIPIIQIVIFIINLSKFRHLRNASFFARAKIPRSEW